MKKCWIVGLAAVVSALAGSVWANEPDSARFIEFGGTAIDGHVARPALIAMEAHRRAKFERLLTLKKSFRAELTDSAHAPELR